MDDFQELANKRVRAELGLDTGVEDPRGVDPHLLAIQRGQEELKKTLEAAGIDNEAATKLLQDEKQQRALIQLFHMNAAEYRAKTAKLRQEKADRLELRNAVLVEAIQILNAKATEYRNMAKAIRSRKVIGDVTVGAGTFAVMTLLRRLIPGS